MKMTTISFREFIQEYAAILPVWMQSISSDKTVTTINVPFGMEIANHDGMTILPGHQRQLGIILEGEAEIYDISECDGIVAYRPIRLMSEGSLFGDFSLLDQLLEIKGPGQPIELWRVIAGRRCFLLRHHIPTPHRYKFYDEFSNRDIFEIFNYLKKGTTAPVKLAMMDFSNLIHQEDLQLALLKYSWLRIKAYRDCINSFNFHAVLKFRNELTSMVKRKSFRSKFDDKRASKKSLLPIFADALFDALNRPLRGELVFRYEAEILNQYFGKSGGEGIIKKDKVLVASSQYSHEFFIPIDINNYFINLSAAISDDKKEIAEVFGIQQVRETQRSTKLSARRFYWDLAQTILNSYLHDNPSYPYQVKCLSEEGPTRPMLLLQFMPRQLLCST